MQLKSCKLEQDGYIISRKGEIMSQDNKNINVPLRKTKNKIFKEKQITDYKFNVPNNYQKHNFSKTARVANTRSFGGHR